MYSLKIAYNLTWMTLLTLLCLAAAMLARLHSSEAMRKVQAHWSHLFHQRNNWMSAGMVTNAI